MTEAPKTVALEWLGIKNQFDHMPQVCAMRLVDRLKDVLRNAYIAARLVCDIELYAKDSPVARMKRHWDRRGKEDALFWTVFTKNEEDFFASGSTDVGRFVLPYMPVICNDGEQVKIPKTMRVLEIGCGSGRLLRALAEHFGEVVGIDIFRRDGDKSKRASAQCSERFSSRWQW